MRRRAAPEYDEQRLRQWRLEIERYRLASGLTYQAVADRISPYAPDVVAEETVRNWLSKSTPPPASMLEHIAIAVGADYIELASVLGLIPASYVDVAVDAIRLSTENLRLSEQLDELRVRSGAARVVEAVSRSSSLAAAVMPVYQGVADRRFRVSDRITLAPIDFREMDRDELRGLIDAELGEVLRSVSAIAWNVNTIDCFRPDRGTYEVYAIRVLEALRGPVEPLPAMDVESVVVLSTVINAFPATVAAILADALGFGLLSLRQLTSLRHGQAGGDSGAARRSTLRSLLSNPIRNRAYCTAFSTSSYPLASGSLEVAQFAAEVLATASSSRRLVVVLAESDEMLASDPSAGDWHDFARSRDALVQAARSEEEATTLILHLDCPNGLAYRADEARVRDWYTERCLAVALIVLRVLESRLGGPPVGAPHPGAPAAVAAGGRWYASELDRFLGGTVPRRLKQAGLRSIELRF